MKVVFIGEAIGKFEDLIIGEVYEIEGNKVWASEHSFVIVIITAEEALKNFEC